VTDIFIVSDNGPGTGGLGSQEVQVDNTNVNGTIYTYEPTSIVDCKNGGWQNFTFPPGPFKNQGTLRELLRNKQMSEVSGAVI